MLPHCVLPVVAVQISPKDPAPVLEERLLSACSAGLKRARCVAATRLQQEDGGKRRLRPYPRVQQTIVVDQLALKRAMCLGKRLDEILVQAEKGVATELRSVLMRDGPKGQGLRQPRGGGIRIDLNGQPGWEGNLPRRQRQRPNQKHATEQQEAQQDHPKETTGTSPTPPSLHFTQHKVVIYNRF